jgi:hypothetical protein
MFEEEIVQSSATPGSWIGGSLVVLGWFFGAIGAVWGWTCDAQFGILILDFGEILRAASQKQEKGHCGLDFEIQNQHK